MREVNCFSYETCGLRTVARKRGLDYGWDMSERCGL
jgi:hypothetical protein